MNQPIIYTPETDFHLQAPPHSTILIGDFFLQGLHALQDAVLEAAEQGQRVHVFDAGGDWNPETSRIGAHLQVHPMDAYRRTPVLPAGQIQVFPVPLKVSETPEMDALWDSLDPQSALPAPDVLVFSRTVHWMMGKHWPHLECWLGEWTEKAQVLLYVDGHRDLYDALLSSFDEVIVYPHEVTESLAGGLDNMGCPVEALQHFPPGGFVRIPEPLNNIP